VVIGTGGAERTGYVESEHE